MKSIALVLLLQITGFSANLAVPTSGGKVDRAAQRKWEKAMRVVHRALETGPFDPKAYGDASEFLENSTCIFAGDNMSCFIGGRLPGLLLKETIPRWEAWWLEHKTEVYFDAEFNQLRLVTGKGPYLLVKDQLTTP